MDIFNIIFLMSGVYVVYVSYQNFMEAMITWTDVAGNWG